MNFIKDTNAIMASGSIKQSVDTQTTVLSYTQVNLLAGNQGLGAFTAGYVSYSRNGDSLHYSGKLTVGATTPSEARLPLPNGLLSAGTDRIPSLRFAGDVIDGTPTFNRFPVLIEPSVGYIAFGYEQEGVANTSLTKTNGNILFSTGTTFSFDAVIPIQGWSAIEQSQPNFMVSLPTSKENRFSAEISSTGGINKVNTDFISSASKTGTGQYTIVFKSGVFNVAPILVSSISQSSNIITRVASLTSSQMVIETVAFGPALADSSFSFELTKQSPDYTAPGVFVGNVAKNQVAIVQYRGNGTRTTLSTSPVAMPLTTVKGDSTIVSIANNQFTLQAGEYDIDWTFLYYSAGSGANCLHYLYDITASSEVERGITGYITGAASAQINLSGASRISVSSIKSFELRVVMGASGGAPYLGENLVAPNDLNGFIKITKLN